VKPSLRLEFSLRDARVSGTVLTWGHTAEDGKFSLLFENGIRKKSGKTGKAAVMFSGIDFDQSYVLYDFELRKERVEFERFADDIEKFSCDIMEETYGENVTKLMCAMADGAETWDAEVFIYHTRDTVYIWEDK